MRGAMARVLIALLAIVWADDSFAGKRRKALKPSALTEAKAQAAKNKLLAVAAAPVILPVPAAHSLVHAIRDELKPESRPKKGRKLDDVAIVWLEQLAAHFAGPEATPAWVDLDGYLSRALVVMEEMRRAGDYGLDPAPFTAPALAVGRATARDLAAAEIALTLAVTRYAWHAKGGRYDPAQLSLWLDQTPRPMNVVKLIGDLRLEGDPAAALRALHPQHPQFEALRRAYLAELQPKPLPEPQIPAGPRVAPGTRHPDVALVRRRFTLAASTPDGDDLYDGDLQQRVSEFMREAGYGRRRAIDDSVRAALNRPASSGNRAQLTRLLVNMERWRWMPRDLGQFHIWNNLPEFETRVMKNGEVVHQERIIIGQLATQTPVFSRRMTHVIFHPDWGVPESIKISSLLARLKGGDTRVLAKRNMRIFDGEREISPKSIKWNEVDIRNVPIRQRSGSGNPLGQLKFMFPNKHDVYMHDTPGKHLFASKVRTFSHGCIRVRNPQRLAEVLLGEIKGWIPADVRWQMRQKTTRLDLERSIPVHNTYFTLWADATGNLVSFNDVYGHDRRIAEALAGKPLTQIAAYDPALAQKKKNEDLIRASEETAAFAAVGGTPLSGIAPLKSAKAASSATPTGFSFFWFGDSKPVPPKPALAKKPARKKTASQ